MTTNSDIKNEFENKLENLAIAYKQKHTISTSSIGRFFGIDRHYGMIENLVKQAHDIKNNEDNQDFIYNTLIQVFEAGAKTAFPNMQTISARTAFVNKLNAQPEGHLFYRTIGLIIKDFDKGKIYKDINQIDATNTNINKDQISKKL